MLTALNQKFEAVSVKDVGIDHGLLFCPVCGEEVKLSTITEKRKISRKKRKNSLDNYIPLDKTLPVFVHKKRMCYANHERETVEHVMMKYAIATAFHQYHPHIDYGLARFIDVDIHEQRLAIECQSSQITVREMQEVIQYYMCHNVRTLFVWGHRVFSRLKEAENHKFHTLNATTAENAYLSNLDLFIPKLDDRDTRRALAESAESHNPGPILYIFYMNGKLQWLHIVRRVKTSYIGTVHPFNAENIEIKDNLNGYAFIEKRR